MDQKSLKPVLDWAKTTDLEEVALKGEGVSLEFKTLSASVVPDSPFPQCSLTPVLAHEVGLFHFDGRGKAGAAEMGAFVESGAVLGRIETGAESCPVAAPASGKIAAVRIEDGKPVEYGQPLFFIQNI